VGQAEADTLAWLIRAARATVNDRISGGGRRIIGRLGPWREGVEPEF
jgi:hypothetical protein